MSEEFSNLSPAEREQRLTALLLGELPPTEAEEVQRALAADPELAREHERLRHTIELVRETTALDRDAATARPPLRLDDARRQQLLARFRTPARHAVRPRRWRKWFVPLSAAAALIGLLALAMTLPMLTKAKSRAQRVTSLSSYGMGEISKEAAVPEIKFYHAKKSAPTPLSKTPAVPTLALPSLTDGEGDVRLQISGQMQAAGATVVSRGTYAFSVGAATDAGYLTVNGSDQTVIGGEGRPLPVTAPVAADSLRAPTVTTTSGRATVAPVQGGDYLITDLATDSAAPAKDRSYARKLNLGLEPAASATVSKAEGWMERNADAVVAREFDQPLRLDNSTLTAGLTTKQFGDLSVNGYASAVLAPASEPARPVLQNATTFSGTTQARPPQDQNGQEGVAGKYFSQAGNSEVLNYRWSKQGATVPAPTDPSVLQNLFAATEPELAASGQAVFYYDQFGRSKAPGAPADRETAQQASKGAEVPSSLFADGTKFMEVNQAEPQVLGFNFLSVNSTKPADQPVPAPDAASRYARNSRDDGAAAYVNGAEGRGNGREKEKQLNVGQREVNDPGVAWMDSDAIVPGQLTTGVTRDPVSGLAHGSFLNFPMKIQSRRRGGLNPEPLRS